MASVAPRRRRVAFLSAFLLLAAVVLPVLTATRGVAVAGVPSTVTLSPNPIYIHAGSGSQVVTATVRDSNGAGVANQTVVWSSNGGAGFSPQTSTTNASGVATVTVSANGTTGPQTITGTAAPASGTAMVYAYGPPAHVSLTLGPAVIPANGAATSQALVRVTDGHTPADPIPSGNVTLATNGDVTISPVTNRGDGTYAATITASTTADTETITATETTSSLSTTAALREAPPSVLNGVFYNTATANSPSSWLPPIQDMQTWQGKGEAILNFYSGGLVDNTALTNTLTAIWNQDHAVPLVSWVGPYNNQQALTAQGALDTNIDATANALKTFVSGPDGVYGNADDRRLYFRYDWEANGSWYQYSPNYTPVVNGSPVRPSDAEYQQNVANFKASWQHTHDRFVHAGLDSNHVAWVFSVAQNDSYRGICQSCSPPNWNQRQITEDIYPGDAYVDWLGIDGYNWGNDPANNHVWQTPDEVFDTMMNRLRAIAPTKPIGVNEVGIVPVGSTVAQRAQWITDYFNWLHGTGAWMKMSLWFNTTNGADFHIFGGGYGDSTYVGTSGTYNAYSTYASAMASNSVIPSDPSNPRLLTDAQFLGQ